MFSNNSAASVRDCMFEANGSYHGGGLLLWNSTGKIQNCIIRNNQTYGMHINAVGGDCPGKTEIHADVLRAASVFVEYEPQTRVEGELQQMPADFAVTELWQVLQGHSPGRLAADTVTVFDSVGFALEDFSALRYMRTCAERLGVGQDLALVPRFSDPKDLFGLIAPLSAGAVDVAAAPARVMRRLATEPA